MASLKFNLSFKKEEFDLYKAAVIDQRCPGSFIKDAIEFYLAHLKQRGVSTPPPQPQITHVAQNDPQEVEDNVSTDDLLDF